MAIIITGLNHKTAPVEIREKLAFSKNELEPGLAALRERYGLAEAVILSTCNRTEIYGVTGPDPGEDGIRRFFSETKGVTGADLKEHLYCFTDEEAIRHLLSVAASLDSMVVGEVQILGQVKDAYAAAGEARATGPVFNGLFQRVMKVAKRIRTETDIGRMPVSISSVAVDLARSIFGEIENRTVMIMGAGEMSELTARYLVDGGAGSVLVSNRTYEKACRLAEEFNGKAIKYDEFPRYMIKSDIVVGSTDAPHYVIHHSDVIKMMKERKHRPMFFIDISVPRNIDPRVNDIENVYLYNIDDLQGVAEHNMQARGESVREAESFVDDGLAGIREWLNSLGVVPTITDLQKKMGDLGRQELEKSLGKMKDISDADREKIIFLVESLVKKFLNDPFQRLRQQAKKDGAFRETGALRYLFKLDNEEKNS